MNVSLFEEVKVMFQNADVDEKIKIYSTTRELTAAQYKELLRLYPTSQLHRLEQALE